MFLAPDNGLCTELHEYTLRLYQYIFENHFNIIIKFIVISKCSLSFPTTYLVCIDVLTDACYIPHQLIVRRGIEIIPYWCRHLYSNCGSAKHR
jgi:hypothetical protein